MWLLVPRQEVAAGEVVHEDDVHDQKMDGQVVHVQQDVAAGKVVQRDKVHGQGIVV